MKMFHESYVLNMSQLASKCLIFLVFFLPAILQTCPCEHTYDADVIALIDAEGDTCLHDVYDQEDVKLQMIDPGHKPEKLLQQASYAFDTFRYNKCLEKIKEYEKVAFPPPYDYPSPKEKLTILAYKAYCNRFLKKYDSAIHYFEEMIDIIKKTDYLAPECKFITYYEHAHCYLLKGNRKEFQNRIVKIIDLDIAPKYEYYVKNDFKVHHQPCFHNHNLKYEERFVFNEIAPIVLGEKLYATLEARGEIPKIYTVSDNREDKEFCRRMCYRASTVSAIIVGCITKRKEAAIAAAALAELLIDCEICCTEGWGSKNCCKDLKWVFHQVCQQHVLDEL